MPDNSPTLPLLKHLLGDDFKYEGGSEQSTKILDFDPTEAKTQFELDKVRRAEDRARTPVKTIQPVHSLYEGKTSDPGIVMHMGSAFSGAVLSTAADAGYGVVDLIAHGMNYLENQDNPAKLKAIGEG